VRDEEGRYKLFSKSSAAGYLRSLTVVGKKSAFGISCRYMSRAHAQRERMSFCSKHLRRIHVFCIFSAPNFGDR
jgi:hypothetical protein